MEKIPLLLMFLGHVWVDATQGVLPVVLTKLKENFELTYFQVGVMVMVLNLTSSMIQPLFGVVADRARVGWFVYSGVLWTSLCMGLLGWVPNYALAVFLVGLAGLGTAAFHPRAMMTVSLVSGTRRGFGAAVFSTGGNLGFAVGPMIGSLLVLGLGLRGTLVLLFPGFLLFLAIIAYSGDALKREVHTDGMEADGDERGTGRIFWYSLSAVSLVIMLRSWAYMSFIAYLPMYLQTRNVPLAQGSLTLTVFLVGGALSGLYGGHLSDRIGRKAVVVGSLLIYPLLASLMLLSNGLWVWFLAGTAGAALLASFSVTVVWTQELLPRNLGLASGLSLGLGFGMGGLGAALTGYIADLIGLYGSMWVLALVPAVGALAAAPVRTSLDARHELLWSEAERG
ncbi:MAG: MFS transporter [Desulfobacteraceae bacterium]